MSLSLTRLIELMSLDSLPYIFLLLCYLSISCLSTVTNVCKNKAGSYHLNMNIIKFNTLMWMEYTGIRSVWKMEQEIKPARDRRRRLLIPNKCCSPKSCTCNQHIQTNLEPFLVILIFIHPLLVVERNTRHAQLVQSPLKGWFT